MQREGDLPVHRHAINRGTLGPVDPRLRHPVLQRLPDYLRVVGIEEDVELGLIQVLGVFCRRRFLDPVGVVQQYTEIADAPDAGFRTDGRLPRLDARVAEDAFLRFAGTPVVVDLLVGAGGDAHAPAAALVLVDQDDAVLLPLVDRSRRAGCNAARVQAMLAQPRQIHHEGVFELAVDVLFERFEIHVLAALGEFAAEDLLPVRPPLDLFHPLSADQRTRARRRRSLRFRRVVQMLVVESEGLVIVVDLRHVRVGEYLRQDAQLAAHLRHDAAVFLAHPAAVPDFLVLPFLGIADAGLGLDIVEPGVFHALAAGPDILAGHRAGVAADAFVEIQNLAYLCANLHSAASIADSIAGPR